MLSYCLIQLHIIHNSNKSITNFKKNSLLQPELGRCCSVYHLCSTRSYFLVAFCFFLICLNIPSVHQSMSCVLVCQGLFMDVCQSQRFIKVCQKVFVPAIHGFTWVTKRNQEGLRFDALAALAPSLDTFDNTSIFLNLSASTKVCTNVL